MTNNSIFTRVLALMLCLIMLVGTLTACLNQVEPENHVGTTNGGVVTTNPTTNPTTTTPTTPTTGGVVEDNPVEDPVEPVDPNEIFSASTNISSDALIYGSLASDVVIGGTEVGALVPADVKVEAGASSLALSVKKVDEEVLGDALSALDVHINGVALDNTVPMVVKLGAILEAGLGATELKLYHTENGVDNLMTRVNSPADFAIHNQYYYNVETGEVTIYIASFSVISAVKSVADVWDGGSDTSWYNENDTEFTLTTAEQLAGFRDLVDAGNTFEGKTVILGADIDLYLEQKDKNGDTIMDGEVPALVSFDPIGKGYVHNGGQAFMGTFDGQGHTIYNLYQNGWNLGYSYSTVGGGLFASVVNATIKNLTVNGANIVMECIDMGIVAGYVYGTCVFSNIIVTNSKIANYNRYTGGVVGEVGGNPANPEDPNYIGNHTFENIIVDSSVKLSALWGTFDPSVGGVIGGKWGNVKVIMRNVTVACELDVFSDATAAYEWYAYRRCGMLIGYTEQESPKKADKAAADFLICENVNVYYGDWVNYHYCEFSDYRYPWVRVEAGEHHTAYKNPRHDVAVDKDGNLVVDDNHTHREGEGHNVVITFNQLYGGGQGVYGCAEHKGVVTNSKEFKTIYVHNTAGWENLKLQYWFANGNDTWTTIIDGIDMTTMLVEGNVYKIQLPVSAYAFKIVADGQDGEEFVLGNLESGATVTLGTVAHEHTYDNACDTTCNGCEETREVGGHIWDGYICSECGTDVETKIVYIQNNLSWNNLKLYYWVANGDLTEGKSLTLENGVYKLEIPAYADGFKITGMRPNNAAVFSTPEIAWSEVNEKSTYPLNAFYWTLTINGTSLDVIPGKLLYNTQVNTSNVPKAQDYDVIIYDKNYTGTFTTNDYGVAIVLDANGKLVKIYDGANVGYYTESGKVSKASLTASNYATLAFSELTTGQTLMIFPNDGAGNHARAWALNLRKTDTNTGSLGKNMTVKAGVHVCENVCDTCGGCTNWNCFICNVNRCKCLTITVGDNKFTAVDGKWLYNTQVYNNEANPKAQNYHVIVYDKNYKGTFTTNNYGVALVINSAGQLVKAYDWEYYYDLNGKNTKAHTADNYATYAFSQLKDGETLLIFPNDGSNTTNGRSFAKSICDNYSTTMGVTVTLETPAGLTKTIYFQNNWKWTEVRAYYWFEDAWHNISWPGVTPTKISNDGTYDIYKIDVPANAIGLIISGVKNDGSGTRTQTLDINVNSITKGNIYWCSFENTVNNATKVELSSNKYTDGYATHDIYLKGDFNNWALDVNYKLTPSADGKTWTGNFTFEKTVTIKLFNTLILNDVNGWIGGKGYESTNGNVELAPGKYTITYYADGNNFTFNMTERKIYLKATGWEGGARFAVYVWNGSGNEWIDMTKESEETYSCFVPVTYTKIIFGRMNSSTTANNWDNKWNQSGDETIPTDGRNLWTVTTAYGGDNKSYGSWSRKTD